MQFRIGEVVICDTSGDCLPDGVSKIIAFVLETASRLGCNLEVGWHGHNDKGLSVANANSAIESGANLISGTFTGIGERAGNIPLEQIIYLLAERGSKAYNLSLLQPMCTLLASATGTSLLASAPIVGNDIFSTSTGTHAAAILKSRKVNSSFEDVIYSSVPASSLQRRQTIIIGPNSGKAAIRFKLEEIGQVVTEQMLDVLLKYCKGSKRNLSQDGEILDIIESIKF